jgi:hypothetical protein
MEAVAGTHLTCKFCRLLCSAEQLLGLLSLDIAHLGKV